MPYFRVFESKEEFACKFASFRCYSCELFGYVAKFE